jgi:arginase
LREAGLVDALAEEADVLDYGDVELPEPSPERDRATGLIDPRGFEALVPAVRRSVSSVLDDGRFPLVVGGDCPIMLGCLAAVPERPLGLVFVDGHEDAYLPERSLTGEAADTELAFALGMVDTRWSAELDDALPRLAEADVRMLGPRDRAQLDAEDVPSLAARVPLVDGERVASDPGGETVAALRSLSSTWWFHVDLDVLSTAELPAIDYPQDGGLSWAALQAVTRVALRASPVGWDVTIYNPDLDPERVHAERIVRFLGWSIRELGAREGGAHGGPT